jgi:hypothetical protein
MYQGSEEYEAQKKLSGHATAVLRNLAHNTEQHTLLVQSGAMEALVGIMRERSQVRVCVSCRFFRIE